MDHTADKSPALSIIICTYNNAGQLAKTAKHTLACMQRANKHTRAELIIIDNNSTDQTRSIATSLARTYRPKVPIRILREKRQGISFARNRGILASRARYVVFVDDDTILDRTWFYEVRRIITSKKKPLIVAGMVRLEPSAERHPLTRMLRKHDSLWSLGIVHLGEAPRRIKHEFLILVNNTIFDRSVFRRVGLFDTQFGSTHTPISVTGAEDIDLFQRISYGGLPIQYEPSLGATHIVTNKLSMDYLKKRYYDNGREIALFRAKHGRVARWGTSFYMRKLFYAVAIPTLMALGIRKSDDPALQWYELRLAFWSGYVDIAKQFIGFRRLLTTRKIP